MKAGVTNGYQRSEYRRAISWAKRAITWSTEQSCPHSRLKLTLSAVATGGWRSAQIGGTAFVPVSAVSALSGLAKKTTLQHLGVLIDLGLIYPAPEGSVRCAMPADFRPRRRRPRSGRA